VRVDVFEIFENRADGIVEAVQIEPMKCNAGRGVERGVVMAKPIDERPYLVIAPHPNRETGKSGPLRRRILEVQRGVVYGECRFPGILGLFVGIGTDVPARGSPMDLYAGWLNASLLPPSPAVFILALDAGPASFTYERRGDLLLVGVHQQSEPAVGTDCRHRAVWP
jgi:hypothetical protein